MFSDNYIKLHSVDSTNSYALRMKGDLLFREGLVVAASYQTRGNGQKGNSWESLPNENLLISVVIEPDLLVKSQFLLTKCIALAIYDLVSSYIDNVSVKWPNDILVDRKKIAGILIQNILRGDNITHSVIGIGLNVNQTKFNNYSPEATSLRLLLDQTFDLDQIKNSLLSYLSERIQSLKIGVNQQEEYLSVLFLSNQVAVFESKEQKFTGVIKGVGRDGKLHIQLEDNSLAEFDNQEVKFFFRD